MWTVSLILGLALAPACGVDLESGVYVFQLNDVQRSTCSLALPPETWEGHLDMAGEVFNLSFFEPAFHGAAGGQALVGRFFGEADRDFIADTGFDTTLQIDDLRCPAFFQLHLQGEAPEDDALIGAALVTYQMDRAAPLSCPRSCAIEWTFEALRDRDLEEDWGI